jgi:hypothetical protein
VRDLFGALAYLLTSDLRTGDLTALDAAALARLGSWIITTPNTPWVPKPFMEKEALQMRADGRFGYIDPYQWPQLWSEQYPWSVAIPSKNYYSSPSPIAWAWYTPRYEDFVLQKDSGKGNLNRTTIAGLRGLLEVIQSRFKSYQRAHLPRGSLTRAEGVHSTLKKLWNIIELSHLSWRDTVVHVGDYERVFLELYAIMDYDQLILDRLRMQSGAATDSDPGHPRWLGGFTKAPLMAEQLFAAGVPVWLIRDEAEVSEKIIVQDIVDAWDPTDIVVHHYVDPVGQFAWPFDIVYKGQAGDETMHAKIREATYRAKVLENPSTSDESGSRVHRTARNGVDGWQPCK